MSKCSTTDRVIIQSGDRGLSFAGYMSNAWIGGGVGGSTGGESFDDVGDGKREGVPECLNTGNDSGDR